MVIEETWDGRGVTPVVPAGSRAVTFSEIMILIQQSFFTKANAMLLPEEGGASI